MHITSPGLMKYVEDKMNGNKDDQDDDDDDHTKAIEM